MYELKGSSLGFYNSVKLASAHPSTILPTPHLSPLPLPPNPHNPLILFFSAWVLFTIIDLPLALSPCFPDEVSHLLSSLTYTTSLSMPRLAELFLN